jgi:hypothetical protein
MQDKIAARIVDAPKAAPNPAAAPAVPASDFADDDLAF